MHNIIKPRVCASEDWFSSDHCDLTGPVTIDHVPKSKPDCEPLYIHYLWTPLIEATKHMNVTWKK